MKSNISVTVFSTLLYLLLLIPNRCFHRKKDPWHSWFHIQEYLAVKALMRVCDVCVCVCVVWRGVVVVVVVVCVCVCVGGCCLVSYRTLAHYICTCEG